MAERTPPRFVPTLTEVVPGPAGRVAAAPARLSEDVLVHRIMQRIDLTLDKRLREAVAGVVLAHTRELAPALRTEVEAVVAATVAEAISEELGAVPSGRPAP